MGKFMCAVWCKFFSGGSLLYYRVFGEFFIFRKKMRFIQGVEHNNAIVEFLINSLSFNAVSMMNWIDIRLPLGCISCEINSKRYIQMSKDCFPWKWNGKKCLLFNNITNIIHIHVLIYRRCLHGILSNINLRISYAYCSMFMFSYLLLQGMHWRHACVESWWRLSAAQK